MSALFMHWIAFRTAFLWETLFQHMVREHARQSMLHEKVPQVQALHAMFELQMRGGDPIFWRYEHYPSTSHYLSFLIASVQCNDLVRLGVPCAATKYKVLLHACVPWPQAYIMTSLFLLNINMTWSANPSVMISHSRDLTNVIQNHCHNKLQTTHEHGLKS